MPRSGSPCLLRDYRPLPPSTSSSIMAMYAELYARSNRLTGPRAAVLSVARGMIGLPRRVRIAVSRHGRAARDSSGRSRALQLADICRCWWENGLMPMDYYAGQLARHAGRPEIFAYLPWPVIANVVVALQYETFGPLPFALNDKAAVADWCGRNGFDCPRSIVLDFGAPAPAVEEAAGLGDRLFVKPRSAMAGCNAELWERAGPDEWRWGERRLSTRELHDWFAERATAETNGIIIQEVLANHAGLAEQCGSALSTCRVITLLNERGEPEVVEGRWRMSSDPHAVVDNFYAGGMHWDSRDYETGEIAFGVLQDAEATQKTVRSHPVSGRAMAGTRHPFWPEIRDLALDAHRRLEGVLFVGWDIAMSSRGPVIIEANVPSGMNPKNQMVWDGIAHSRLGEILAWRARGWIRENLESGSRRRIAETS